MEIDIGLQVSLILMALSVIMFIWFGFTDSRNIRQEKALAKVRVLNHLGLHETAVIRYYKWLK